MSNTQHALLSASSAHRWMQCTPSARFTEDMETTTSAYAEEGTLAHDIAEKVLTDKQIVVQADVTAEMVENAFKYKDYIDSLVDESSFIIAEQRIDFSDWVPEGFGTADCIILSEKTLHVIDYKYGKGVMVDAFRNPQMMLYALGAYKHYKDIYEFDRVAMHIVQPRIENYSRYDTSIRDLLAEGTTINLRATAAWEGRGTFEVGDHCKFCPGKMQCPDRVNMMLTVKEEAENTALTLERIEEIFPYLDQWEGFIKDVKAYALEQALAGKQIKGLKLVEGRSNRQYTDTLEVAKKLNEAGYEDAIIYKRELLGLTAMEKAVGGKKKLETLLDGLIEKPQGKPTLVPESDKRPIYNSIEAEFKDVNYDQEENK